MPAIDRGKIGKADDDDVGVLIPAIEDRRLPPAGTTANHSSALTPPPIALLS